jgi:hypothetical protein
MIAEILVIGFALFLIYLILKLRNPPEEQEYYRASDVYNRLAVNDSNPFNLMIDFKEPIKEDGPPGVSSDLVETYDIDTIRRLYG